MQFSYHQIQVHHSSYGGCCRTNMFKKFEFFFFFFPNPTCPGVRLNYRSIGKQITSVSRLKSFALCSSFHLEKGTVPVIILVLSQRPSCVSFLCIFTSVWPIHRWNRTYENIGLGLHFLNLKVQARIKICLRGMRTPTSSLLLHL